MTIKSPGRAALRIPYLAVRTPLGLLDEQVIQRVFGADSTAHRSLARGLHSLDALAASALSTGSGRSAPTAPEPAAAETDDGPADESRAAAEIITDVEPVERDGGEQPLEAEEQQEIEQLADSFLEDEELAPHSGELADNDELRRVQAEIRAKQAVESEHGQL